MLLPELLYWFGILIGVVCWFEILRFGGWGYLVDLLLGFWLDLGAWGACRG